jgi:RNA polymerase sigma-70 factor (ECF subfamily)
VLRAERRDELRSLLTHLSSDQRDVVVMRYAADLSFPEIAAALNKNEAAVRMLLHRGLRKMKAVMDDE